ncbi:MAG TPA: hypothetical protein VF739_06140 [Ktedonobacterales bacterium]
MVTYEDITDMFLNAIDATGLSAHPEFWLNTQTMEREFACALHPGPCEEADHRATCTVSFAWGPLDSVLSFDGAEGVCDFFHEPDEDCPHLHTENVPPLILDLAYTLPMERVSLDSLNLRQLARTLKLRASEHSSRAGETRPSIALALGDSSMEAEALTLQQRVELPLWNPEGVSGFRANTSSLERRSGHSALGRGRARGDQPHPEEWLPHLLAEVADDISRVVVALEEVRSLGQGGAYGSGRQN